MLPIVINDIADNYRQPASLVAVLIFIKCLFIEIEVKSSFSSLNVNSILMLKCILVLRDLALNRVFSIIESSFHKESGKRMHGYENVLFCFFTALQVEAKGEIIIDVDQIEVKELFLSSVVSHVEYIPLELTKECPINKLFGNYVTEQYILAIEGLGPIYMFDRKTGHFIKEISGKGSGPDEYIWVLPQGFDYKRQCIYVDYHDKWRLIDVLKNKCVEEIIKPGFRYQKEGLYQGAILNPYHLRDSCYIGYMNNTTGKIKERFAIFTNTGRVLKSFPNTYFYEVTTTESLYNSGLFYEYKDELYLSLGNDTIYQLKKEKLHPHIIFNLKKDPSLIKYETMDLSGQSYTYQKSDGNISVGSVTENEKYIFFTLFREKESSQGYYDKQSKKTCRTPFRPFVDAGYIDDINGLSNVLISKIHDNCVITAIKATELSERYELGKLKSLSAKGKKIAEQIQFDDNPILVIARLK